MKKKCYILAFTFLCMLVGYSSYGQVNGGDVDPIPLDPVPIEGNPDSHDPCDPWSSDYDYLTCYGLGYLGDHGDPCDPFSTAYDLSQCMGNSGDSGDPCDPYSMAFDYDYCYGEEPDPTDPDPCNSETAAQGVIVSNILSNTNVKQSLNNLPPFTSTTQNEYIFNIKETNGNLETTPIRQIGATGGTNNDYTASVIADLHTHPSGAFVPSAQDLKALDNKSSLIDGFTTSYVSSYDGNIYALYINDPIQLHNFVTNNPGFVGSDHNFNAGTTVGANWLNTIQDLRLAGYTSQEAQTRATALILQSAGVTLLKSDATIINFKKIDIKVVGTDSNGSPIYINIDCN